MPLISYPDRTDWMHPDIFAAINSFWGPLKVDLFATRFSAQLNEFYSWREDSEAVATDAEGMAFAGVS